MNESPQAGNDPGGRPLIVNVSAGHDTEWRWFEADMPEYRWEFFVNEAKNWWERQVRKPNVALTRASWQAVRLARRENSPLIISHDPKATYRCCEMIRLLGVKIPHIAWSFNFADLPRGFKRRLMTRAFADVDLFVTYSSMERALYSDYFGIPIEKIRMKLWGVGRPHASLEEPSLIAGDYICALGENGRDYRTLMAAMSLVPQIPLVAVVRPYNIEGIDVPPNVTIKSNIPMLEAHNILIHSRFMVLPLRSVETPCGHTSLVAAMHLGIPSVVTRSIGIDDYVRDGFNVLISDPNSPEQLADAISRLWNNRELRQTLADNGEQFATESCSEKSIREELARQLDEFGVLHHSTR